MLVLIPAAVGMAVLSYPIMGVFFPQKETIMTATLLLALGSPAIIFYGLSTLTNGILQADEIEGIEAVDIAEARATGTFCKTTYFPA